MEATQAPAPKKKSAAKKKPAPTTTAVATPDTAPAQPTQSSSGGPLGNPNPGGVVGYLATQTSTATKTDTPLIDIPQSITVVTKEQAKDQGSRDLRQALTYVPGVVVGQGEGHRDAPTIRGVSTTADFFVDGVRDDVQYFRDLYNIERVEVLKGANAMIFGRGGGGGVINRVTKKAAGERLYEATTTYGSFDTKRVELDGGQAITNDFAFRILGMYEDSGSYRDFVDLERYGINPKIAFRPDDQTVVHMAYEYFNDDRTVDRGIPSDFLTKKPAKTDPSTFFGNPDESYMTFESHVATATVEHKFDKGIKLKNHTQYGSYEKFYQNIFPNSALHQPAPPLDGQINLGAYNNLTERESIFNQTDLTAKVDTGGGIRHTLLVGTELGYQETDNQRTPGDGSTPTACTVPFSSPTCSISFSQAMLNNLKTPGPVLHTDVTLAGIYVQDQIEMSRYFEVIGGIRFDHFDVDFTNEGTGQQLDRVDNVWSPRVGAVFKPLDYLSFYVSYSKSFLPSTGDQFANLSGGVTGTANLAPEEFLNREIGFKWDITPRLFFTGALFMLDRENTFVTTPSGQVGQVGKTRTEGGELALTGYLTDEWEVVAGYGYQTAEVLVGTTATQGKEVALVPHHTFSLWNKYHFLPNWAAGLGVLSRTGMYANIDNTVTLPGFARVDAALFWDINENIEAQLNVENVFDTEYYATAHNNNNITPGSPQAYYLTLTTRY
ncbi:MAG: TonB-dependent siderophore receptor [Hyphomicrobium sp.]|nr:TonB-dependent siderophore receptor [Hyphomicrobium sp.]